MQQGIARRSKRGRPRFATTALLPAVFALALPVSAQAEPRVTVEPDHGLVDGQTVQVRGEGFTPLQNLVIVQCTGQAEAAGDCDTSNTEFTRSDASGDVAASFTVSAGEVGGGRCDADHDCVIVVSQPTPSPDAERAYAPISFAAAPAPAPDEGAADAPDEQTPGEAAAPDEERAAPTTGPAPAAQDGSPAQASTDDTGPLPDTGSAAMLPSGLALLAGAWLLARARAAR